MCPKWPGIRPNSVPRKQKACWPFTVSVHSRCLRLTRLRPRFLSAAFAEPGGLLTANAQKIAFRPSIAAWALSNRLKKASPCGVPGKRLRPCYFDIPGDLNLHLMGVSMAFRTPHKSVRREFDGGTTMCDAGLHLEIKTMKEIDDAGCVVGRLQTHPASRYANSRARGRKAVRRSPKNATVPNIPILSVCRKRLDRFRQFLRCAPGCGGHR